MPEAVAPPPVAAGLPAAPAPAGGPTEPAVGVRAHLPRRALIVAVLFGLLAGSAVPAALQAADRAAADAQVEGLRSSAATYLTALADGDADLATSMVPVAGVAPAAVLGTAERIEAQAVGLVTVVDDVARIEVRYELAGSATERVLDAERVDGGWRLTTSLAEPVAVHGDGSSSMTVGGVPLAAHPPVALYPGRYTTDVTSTALLRSGGQQLEVDGDPATPTVLHAGMEPSAELERAALAVADGRIAACRTQPDCLVDADGILTRRGPTIVAVDLASGTIDVVVQIAAARGLGDQLQELHARAHLDGAGALAAWECAPIGAPDAAMQPCGP